MPSRSKTKEASAAAIVDHLEWESGDAGLHLQLLEAKINHYLHVIESGEIYVLYPAAAGCDFRVEIAAIHAPTPAAMQFLMQAQTVLEAAGFQLSVVPLGSAYADTMT